MELSQFLINSPMKKILPLTLNQEKYRKVPEGLMWAVPLHEWLSRPAAVKDVNLSQPLARKPVRTHPRTASRASLYILE